jgi:nitrile hydratase accessory protein
MTRASLADLDAALAAYAPLPRGNGQLVFEEPWQGRALGMGVATLERLGLTWTDFRPYLVRSIGRHQAAPGESAAGAYYAAFVVALEDLLSERRVVADSARDRVSEWIRRQEPVDY